MKLPILSTNNKTANSTKTVNQLQARQAKTVYVTDTVYFTPSTSSSKTSSITPESTVTLTTSIARPVQTSSFDMYSLVPANQTSAAAQTSPLSSLMPSATTAFSHNVTSSLASTASTAAASLQSSLPKAHHGLSEAAKGGIIAGSLLGSGTIILCLLVGGSW